MQIWISIINETTNIKSWFSWKQRIKAIWRHHQKEGTAQPSKLPENTGISVYWHRTDERLKFPNLLQFQLWFKLSEILHFGISETFFDLDYKLAYVRLWLVPLLVAPPFICATTLSAVSENIWVSSQPPPTWTATSDSGTLELALISVDFLVKYKCKTWQEHASVVGEGNSTFCVKVIGWMEEKVSRWLSECLKCFAFECF